MRRLMTGLMLANDAPEELYVRFGLEAERECLRVDQLPPGTTA